MSADDHVLGLIPGYALDCLSQEETLQAAEHLSHCASCQAELGSYRRVVDEIHLAGPDAAPPPALKTKLMRRIQEKQAPAVSEQPASAWTRLWSGLQRAAPAWALASLLLVVFLAVSNLRLLQRVNRLEAAAPQHFRMVALAGTDKAPAASGMLVMDQDGEVGTLVVDSLPSLDAAHQYQLWLIQDGQRTSGGVFSVTPDGYGTLVVASERPLNSFSAFGITVEPAGGSPDPTGDKVLGGSL